MRGLLNTVLNLISSWDKSFPQMRTATRAKTLALSLYLTLGRRTLTRTILAAGRDDKDWSADYRLFSRTTWSPCALFRPLLARGTELVKNDPLIAIAYDDTLVRKTGKKIKGSSWQRDPLSPHFNVNLVWGMRYLQASLLLPLYGLVGSQNTPPRGVPVQFEQLPKFKRPSKKASDAEWAKYRELTKTYNTSTTFVKQLRYLRRELNTAGFCEKELLAVCDGSFCNRTCLLHGVDGSHVLARVRKNARLYRRASGEDGRKFYDPESFTPEESRQNEGITYQTMKIFYGGAFRDIRYKDIKNVYWKGGTKRTPLRLIVIAPTPYRRNDKGKLLYREPAYLLTTDMTSEVTVLIQKYFDRWQIEVNFRDEKDLMGLGEGQVWSPRSIPRLPAFVVATYSALLLSSVLAFNDQRSAGALFEKLPKWRTDEQKRPSCLDLLTIMRKEILEKPKIAQDLGIFTEEKKVIYNAAA